MNEPEVSYLRKGNKSAISGTVHSMIEAGELVPVTYPGVTSRAFAAPAALEQLAKIRLSRHVHLLCPFDNLVIQRKRLQQVFGFAYQLECYVPEAKRKYGYYCLPILYGTELVGRLDAKAGRKTGILAIQNLVLESGPKIDEQFARHLADKLALLAAFNSCQTIHIEKCNNKKFKALLLLQVSDNI